MFSPHPALPRRQMPEMPASLSVILRAASSTVAQVGASPSVTPAFSARSVRYITIADSP